MNGLWKLSLGACLLVAGTAFASASFVRAQDKSGEKKPDAGMGMDPAMMGKMMELAAPGKEHQELAKRAGPTEQHYKFRMSPDMPWMEAQGTAESKMLLGGRYLMEETKFDMLGMPMNGIHILGFDKIKGEYISLWMDSMSTWWVTARGKATADGTIDAKGTMIDVAGERPFRMVIKPQAADGTTISEMYDTIPPAGEVKVMEIISKKRS